MWTIRNNVGTNAAVRAAVANFAPAGLTPADQAHLTANLPNVLAAIDVVVAASTVNGITVNAQGSADANGDRFARTIVPTAVIV